MAEEAGADEEEEVASRSALDDGDDEASVAIR